MSPKNLDYSMGNALFELRELKRYSQVEFADAIGVSKAHYNQIELSKRCASSKVLSEIAEFYEIPVSFLHLFSSEPTDEFTRQMQIDAWDNVVMRLIGPGKPRPEFPFRVPSWYEEVARKIARNRSAQLGVAQVPDDGSHVGNGSARAR